MAKLKARGRKELIRITKRAETPENDLTVAEQLSFAIMSDRRILRRRVVWFKPSVYRPTPERHDYGWKQWKRFKPEVNLQDKVRQWDEKYRESGWTIELGLSAVTFSAKHLMRAAQSDENAGFCTECGAQAYGVEPDARNYQCEACGAHSVYGAEELLMSQA